MTEEGFQLPQQLINTLCSGIIAAYDKATARDRLGWIAVIPELVPTLSGQSWTYLGVQLEVTFDSYLEVQRLTEEGADFEALNVLMVTRLERTRLASLEEINAFLSCRVERVEFIRGAEHVEFPDDVCDLSRTGWLAGLLARRRVVASLLRSQRRQQTVRIDLGQSTLVGEVEALEFLTCRLRISATHVFDVSLWSVEPGDVHVVEDSGMYRLPTGDLLEPDGLPVWSYAERCWVESASEPIEEEQGLNALSIRACQAMGTVAFRRYCAHHGLSHPELKAFVKHGFAMADSQDLGEWEQNQPLLVRAGMGHDLPERLWQVVGWPNLSTFLYLVNQVTSIGYTDLYGAVTPAPWRHLRAALCVLDGKASQGRPLSRSSRVVPPKSMAGASLSMPR